MKKLHITVENKVATYHRRDGFIVCGNSDYKIAFSFDSEWDAYADKIARFKWNGGFFDVEFNGDIVNVPPIENATELEVGVYVDGLSTTTPATIPCSKSILCEEAKEYIPTEKSRNLEGRIEALEKSNAKLYKHDIELYCGGDMSAGEYSYIYLTFVSSFPGQIVFVNQLPELPAAANKYLDYTYASYYEFDDPSGERDVAYILFTDYTLRLVYVSEYTVPTTKMYKDYYFGEIKIADTVTEM